MVMEMACGTYWGSATRGWMWVGDVLPEGKGRGVWLSEKGEGKGEGKL